MTRTSIFVVLGIFAVVAFGQLSISSPSYLNIYFPQNGASYYDTGINQVYMTSYGYSVASDATGIINIVDNSNCVGTNNSQFFCISKLSDSTFTQINLTTGLEVEFFQFNQSISSLQSYYNNVMVFFTSDYANVTVINPPSTTPVCTMELSNILSFGSAQYYAESIMTTPSGSCSPDSSCTFFQYFCNGTNTTYDVTLNNSTLPYYYTQIMFLGGQIVGFPYNNNLYEGFIVFGANSTFTQNFGNFSQIGQINSTNILVLNQQSQLLQYQFNPTTGTFTQVGSTLSVPITKSFSISPIANTTYQVAIAYSGALQGSNFFINLNTMTMANWVHSIPPQSFANGTFFSTTNTGWFIADGNTITYQYDSTFTSNPATFTQYANNVINLKDVFVLIEYQNSSNPPQFFYLNLNLTAAATISSIPGYVANSGDKLCSAITNGSSQTIAFANYNQDYISVFNTEAGKLIQTSAYSISTGYASPMVFLSNITNLISIISWGNLYTFSLVNGSQITIPNQDFPAQFGSIQKIDENTLIGYSLNINSSTLLFTLNLSIINIWTQQIKAFYIIYDITESSTNGLEVFAINNPNGSLQGIYVSAVGPDFVSENWIIYPDNSTFAGNISYYVLPTGSNSALFCNSNFNFDFANCTQYIVTDSNNNGGNTPSGSSGSGTIIIVILVIVILLVAGFLVRRNMKLKRSGESNLSGIALAKK